MSGTQSTDSPAASDTDTDSLVASTPAGSEESNGSINSNEPTAEELAIAAHLERIVYDIRDALNARNFDRDAHPWNLCTATYRCEAMSPTSRSNVGLTEQLRDQARLAKENPQIKYHVRDISTHIDPDAKMADCFINQEITGWPPGVTRRSVGVCRFKLVSGVWRRTRHYNSRGIDPD